MTPSGLFVAASLHASLMARLDRLGPAKEVAQIGAAVWREFSHALLTAVVRKSEAELATALDRLVVAGLLFRQGAPPYATYLFKHALVQDAAYGTLLRQPRRALHRHIAETLERQFAEIAENQPELLARHYTEAGLIEKAAGLWSKAGQQSLSRSALVEAIEQLTRALAQISSLSATPGLRREQIKLQVALASPLIHVKGFAAPETKEAVERAHLLIEQAKAIGEAPDDPLLLYSVLFGFWVANLAVFNGDVVREVSAQFLTLAEKEGVTEPIMIGHRLMGAALLFTGDAAQGRSHLDRSINLYNPAQHRPLTTRFAHDVRVAALVHRSWALWILGYPEASVADVRQAIKEVREINQAATSMNAGLAIYANIFCGDYAAAKAQSDELIALATAKSATMWKAVGLLYQGFILAMTGKAADAVSALTSGMAGLRSTGATVNLPTFSSILAGAYADLGQIDEAYHCIEQALMAIETSKERWFEADVHRIWGEITLKSPAPDAAKAEGCFERALAVARQQHTKSWELRAAMSMARLWRDQGKPQQAHELLAPVYGWFTEGFDTRDLKEAKALLNTLAA
jgi:predicted ATPase